jgi:uncharacterized protein
VMRLLCSPTSFRCTLTLACLLSFLPLSASAEGKSQTAAATELIRVMVPKEAYEALIDQMHTQMAGAMQHGNPNALPADKQSSLKAAVLECLPYEDLLAWSAEVYTQHFTPKELKELSAFYKTATGKKTAKLMPVLSGEVMAKMSPVIMQRMPAALKKHGLQ